MTILFGTVLVLMLGLTVYWIYRPLFGTSAAKPSVRPKHEQSKKPDQGTIRSTLNEIEFEYRMNKLSAEDYKQLTDQYQALAAQLTKEEQQKAVPKKKRKSFKPEELEREIDQEIKEALAAIRKKTKRPKQED